MEGEGGSALGELEAFARPGLPGLFTFFHTGVSGEVAGLFEDRSEVAVVFEEGTGDAVGDGDGLALVASAVDAGDDVDFAGLFSGLEGLEGGTAGLLGGEIFVSGLAVDLNLAGARLEADTSGGVFAAADRDVNSGRGKGDGHGEGVRRAQGRGTGCWASWGCLAPA